MTRWLSTEWFDQTRAMAEGQPERPGLSGRLLYEVTGGPEGGVSYYWSVEDGRPVAGAGGGIDDPDATVTLSWDDALAIQQGALDPSVAFMQGRLKVAGSMGVMIRLLSLASSPEGQDLRRRIAAITEY